MQKLVVELAQSRRQHPGVELEAAVEQRGGRQALDGAATVLLGDEHDHAAQHLLGDSAALPCHTSLGELGVKMVYVSATSSAAEYDRFSVK